MDSSSGRQVVYAVWYVYMNRCEQTGVYETHSPTHQTAHNDACKHTIVHIQPVPEDEPTRFETRRIHQKLNINLENCAFRWFVLYHFWITYAEVFK